MKQSLTNRIIFTNLITIAIEIYEENPNGYYCSEIGEILDEEDWSNSYLQTKIFFRDFEIAYYRRGWVQHQLMDYDAAIGDFNHMIDLSSDFTWAYYSKGYSEFESEKYEAAIEDTTHFIQNHSYQFAPAYYIRGYSYYFQGNYSDAMVDAEYANTLDPDFENPYWLLGLLFDEAGNYEDAIKNY